MGVLSRIGLRRANQWEPPTLLDKLLDGPLHYLVAIIYGVLVWLRGRPFAPPSGRQRVRVVCISDTHDQTFDNIPDGDLLIHAGDLTNAGTVKDIQAQIDWLASQPHQHKVMIAGNHDTWLDPVSRKTLINKTADDPSAVPDFKGIHYLEDNSVHLVFKPSGCTLNVYGSPHIPRCGGSDFAFQYMRHDPPWANKIPQATDILVTHTPPQHHLDLGLGCSGLLNEIWRVKPRLHVFGHVHTAAGRQAVYFDDCQRAYENLMARPRRGVFRDLMLPHAGWIDACRVVLYGLNAVLFKWIMQGPGPNHGGLMVNAAQMYRNTGKLGNRPQVVDM
ncbi:hypothetical protein MCOR25_005643 [Pyricularia grisea]|uniref:Calcineurin-like phosphoesterase domain-containing protein n=1 Tax=Pyricularia grisea TaxID=148305 RepID=A0A6P8BBC4_PYRGI|nr:uncharacterized protein PgNI_03722 [Pyricularia grisea]KAI6364512.1 hypothetical protein MCOR25_005643 [Pyricularia grisea]TLD12997.1 hypothetical protein PgNI_03722 [Pyricularia grisea]